MSFPRGFTFIQLRRFQYQMAITKLEDRLISDDLPVTRPCLLTGGAAFLDKETTRYSSQNNTFCFGRLLVVFLVSLVVFFT